MSAPQTGDRINNYLLEELIGTGAFGQVWRARHHMFDKRVAIKIPTDADFVQNLRREGVVIHGLQHPNIVRALDLDPYSDPPYLIMEYVPGDSLRAFVDAYPKGMPIDKARAIMRGLLKALESAHHAGVIHRDVKPANILLSKQVQDVHSITEQCVKIADFGLGKVGGVTTHSIMQSGSMLTACGGDISGTLAYMSPEQKEGQEVDGRSDLYSCGIVLFEMLTGQRPHGAELPSGLRPEVPEALDQLFARCYTRCDHRFASATEMLQALDAPKLRNRQAPSDAVGPKCPSCHAAAQRSDQFCINCGFQLVPSIPRCTNPDCRKIVNVTDRFCIHCGKNLCMKVG